MTREPVPPVRPVPDRVVAFEDARRIARDEAWREKVLDYVTRDPAELLVLDHPDGPLSARLGSRDVRSLVKTEIGLVIVFAVSVLVTYIGLALVISGDNQLAGALILVIGVWTLLAAPVVHDRLHRERGEAAHAVWGRNDRRKPPWWPAR